MESILDKIGSTALGTHICLFYRNKQDLLDVLLSFFRAGLERNELCVWIVSESPNKDEAINAIRKRVLSPSYVCSRPEQMEVASYREWYLKDGIFNQDHVRKKWINRLNKALDSGYLGMRVAGDTAWIDANTWAEFMNYEEIINKTISGSQMTAICTYPIEQCTPTKVMDVVDKHQLVLFKQPKAWRLLKIVECYEEKDRKTKFLEITQEHRGQIEKIIEGMKCPIDFKCYKSGFEKLPESKIVVEGKLIACLQSNQKTCKFGVSFGSGAFCECPLRNYMAKNFHI